MLEPSTSTSCNALAVKECSGLLHSNHTLLCHSPLCHSHNSFERTVSPPMAAVSRRPIFTKQSSPQTHLPALEDTLLPIGWMSCTVSVGPGRLGPC
ncbi:hypothetical protein FKM82_027437 [Ascaphus truei]